MGASGPKRGKVYSEAIDETAVFGAVPVFGGRPRRGK